MLQRLAVDPCCSTSTPGAVVRIRVKANLALLSYVSTIVLANWLTTTFGLVPVGFGLLATAGTYAAGLSFGLRDLCQTYAGKTATFVAVVLGALISGIVAAPQIAVASAVAFLVSESFDFAIYTPLRAKGATATAIVASNTAGSIIDTLLFLAIAGFPVTLQIITGQMVGKGWMTLLAVLTWKVCRAVSSNRS